MNLNGNKATPRAYDHKPLVTLAAPSTVLEYATRWVVIEYAV